MAEDGSRERLAGYVEARVRVIGLRIGRITASGC
jgi:hypothetical protein